ncbi:MAG TPA: glycosyltransferase [Candidatus Acidoferrum sp.]|nr:glycosyltransferase [Candidatus Acidoferrum sp.]
MGTPFDANITELLKLCSEEPLAIFHPESDFPLFPFGLTETLIPTLCFQVDAYAYTEHRYKWSCLFDNVGVFHPGFAKNFKERGHAGAFLNPHAVRKTLYTPSPEEKMFEIGWVGQSQGPIYRRRESLLPQLAKTFQMNDWKRTYKLDELASVYRRSRIVVNIGRDDYPQDANLRTLEAMAGGALLITSLPTELIDLGFIEGQDFIGYNEETDVVPLAKRYLNDESSRARIAEAGKDKVLRHHTYQERVANLIAGLKKTKSRFAAPARKWPKAKVDLAYMDYYAANGALPEAAKVLPKLMFRNPIKGVEGSIQLLRALARKTIAKLRG